MYNGSILLKENRAVRRLTAQGARKKEKIEQARGKEKKLRQK